MPAAKRILGERKCTAFGITNPSVYAACVLDVGATCNGALAAGDSFLDPSSSASAGAIDLGLGDSAPALSYDPATRDTYVAWIDNSANPMIPSGPAVKVCVVTTAAPSCNATKGPYRLADPLADQGASGAVYSDPQIVVQPGGRVVVAATVSGADSGADPPGYAGTGVVAWTSPAGGGAFGSTGEGIADGGEVLANTTDAGGAVALDATDIGIYAPGGAGFTDFTVDAPAPSTTPVVNSTSESGNQGGISGNQLASVPDPSAPGRFIVVGVGVALNAPGCPTGQESSGLGVGIDTPTGLQSQPAWSSSYFSPISCQAAAPVLAGGGPNGGTIGLLEDEGPGLNGPGANGVYYRRFDPSSNSFQAPTLVSDETKLSNLGATEVSVSQDSSGGVYASWGDNGGNKLSYSSDSGTSWTPPAATGLTLYYHQHVIVAAVGAGSAELAYTGPPGLATQEYLLQTPAHR